MRKASFLLPILGLLAFISLPTTSAHAQATRTWVSGVGDDANPCSRTAPCKTFAGAIAKTAANGEISALDPGGFGAVTITKSITINGDSDLASILSAGTSGVIINAGVNDKITLRNLSINGIGTGLNGIRFLGGKSLVVENVTIDGVTINGIDFQPPGAASLLVSRSVISNSTSNGINIQPGVSGTAMVSLDGARLHGNGVGLRVADGGSAMVRGSQITGSSGDGVLVTSTSRAADVMFENSGATSNAGNGLLATGAFSTVRIGNSVASYNTLLGLASASGGATISFGNNRLVGNGSGSGTPTVTSWQQ